MQMLKKIFPLLILILVGGYYIIKSNKNISNSQKKSTEIQSISKIKQLTPEVKQNKETRIITNKAISFSSSRQAIFDCTGIKDDKVNSIHDLGEMLNIEQPRPENIIRHNFIYQIKDKEFRISMYSSEDGSTWNIDEFSTDNEGLPIPGKKNKSKDYLSSVENIKTKISTYNSSFDEIDYNFSIPKYNGTALLVNDKLERVSIISQQTKKSLDCRRKTCRCY